MDVFNKMYETWILQSYQFNFVCYIPGLLLLDWTFSTEYPNLTLIDFVQVFITNQLYTKQFNLF